MARMHSRKRGESGSTRPSKKTNPIWMRYKPKEIELLVVKLAKEGRTASQIGVYLRDVYGIPHLKTVCKKSVTEILADRKILPEIPEDLMALIKKSIQLRKHMEDNRGDNSALRGLQLTESKIKRLVRYYKSTNKLAEDWKYDPDKSRLYVG